MSFGTFLAVLVLMFIAYFLIASLKGGTAVCGDIEEETTTTSTTSDERELNIVGNLMRQAEGIQSFVVDPADQQKVWLNSNDDMYEDARGYVWKLV